MRVPSSTSTSIAPLQYLRSSTSIPAPPLQLLHSSTSSIQVYGLRLFHLTSFNILPSPLLRVQ